MPLGWPQAIVALVALQRLGELWLSARNARALRRAGAVESGARHYLWLVGLHAAWLLALFVAVPATAPIDLAWLGLYGLLQALRAWILWSLGRFWTTRVLSLADAPLVRRGPYRFCRHPNYAVVMAETLVLPLVFGAWAIALVFGLLNAGLLGWRIRVEERALAARRRHAEVRSVEKGWCG